MYRYLHRIEPRVTHSFQGRTMAHLVVPGAGIDGRSCAACHGAEGEDLTIKQIARYPVCRDGEIVTLQE
jgi:cytochrome c553